MSFGFTQHWLLRIALAVLDYDSLAIKINVFFHRFETILNPFSYGFECFFKRFTGCYGMYFLLFNHHTFFKDRAEV